MSERELGKILAKLDAIHLDLKYLRDEVSDLELRVRDLERSRSLIKGVWITFSAMIGYLVAKLKGVL